MYTLSLLRHAKSSWSDPTLADPARPLNGRGRRAASAVGAWIAASGRIPDEVLCSTAERTRETLERAVRAWPRSVPTHFEGRLYHADPEALLEFARRPGTADHRMLVGHHPGLHELAVALAAEGDPSDLAALRDHFPTGALAIIELPADRWQAIRPGTGRLLAFVRPRELDGRRR